MNRFLKYCLITAVFVAPGLAAAFEYNPNHPMVIVYQLSNGKYKACGPLQCTSTSEANPNTVFDRAKGNDYGAYLKIANAGKCEVYQALSSIKSYDNNAEWVVNRTSDKCY